ncbi:MAG: hypothetical protein U0790_05990 [Isosphaeraceae bacterium]
MIQGTWNPPSPRRWPRALAAAALLVALAAGPIGCATMGQRGASLVPTRYQLRTGPFLLYSDTPIPADSTAIRCLHSLETDLTGRLGYRSKPDEEPVEIYVLNDRNAYTHFLKFYYPELPQRRAFFLAQADRRVIYTYLSERLEEDLRHEATHALMRGCYGDLPLWLDEGLAEYFEARSGAEGRDEHLARITEDLAAGWKPDLARLESLTDIHHMTPRDYRESWAWVHLLLESPAPDRSPLVEYLGRRDEGTARPPLSAVLASLRIDAHSLERHLDDQQSQLAARSPEPRPQAMTARTSAPATTRIARRVGAPIEPGPEPAVVRAQTPTRPGLLRRIGSFLGF